jgi:RNA polymerase sigma factor (sigma-70 family)
MRTITDGQPIAEGCKDREDHRSEDLWWFLLRLGLAHARRRGLTREDAEDCAMEFVARMLREKGRPLPADRTGYCFAAWLNRCARNFAEDFCRRKERLVQHETAWPESQRSDETSVTWECTGDAPSPEHGALQGEFWSRVMAAIERLPPVMRELLVRHHLHGECIRELATAFSRKPCAIEQTLFRARRRLRVLLEGMGLTEPELRAYIVASLNLQTQCLRVSKDVISSVPTDA